MEKEKDEIDEFCRKNFSKCQGKCDHYPPCMDEEEEECQENKAE